MNRNASVQGAVPPVVRALSLAEVVGAIVIAGVALPAVMNTVGATKLGQSKTADRRAGHLLAQALMSEISTREYADPDEVAVFGCEVTESTETRSNWDDVDDYNLWSACPPQEKNGIDLTERAGWCRAVIVEYVDPSDLMQAVVYDSGVKRVTVTVTHHGAVVAELVAIRTEAGRRFTGDPSS